MPLTLTEEVEHPDVTALKARVREVAEKYARAHNWCDVVNRALSEAGVLDVSTLNVEVTYTIGGSEPQQVIKRFSNVADLIGKTPEEQNEIVAGLMTTVVLVEGSNVTLPVTVLDLNDAGDRVASNGIPAGYIGLFASDTGRVRHLRLTPPFVNDGGTVSDWLSRQHGRGVYFACGEISYAPRETSSRSEDRTCARCNRSVPS